MVNQVDEFKNSVIKWFENWRKDFELEQYEILFCETLKEYFEETYRHELGEKFILRFRTTEIAEAYGNGDTLYIYDHERKRFIVSTKMIMDICKGSTRSDAIGDNYGVTIASQLIGRAIANKMRHNGLIETMGIESASDIISGRLIMILTNSEVDTPLAKMALGLLTDEARNYVVSEVT